MTHPLFAQHCGAAAILVTMLGASLLVDGCSVDPSSTVDGDARDMKAVPDMWAGRGDDDLSFFDLQEEEPADLLMMPDLNCARTLGVPDELAGYNNSFCANVGDLDGDGKVDLVVGGSEGKIINMFKNVGGGKFAPAIPLNVSDRALDAAIGDLDGDGTLDIAAAIYSGRSVNVLLNRGNGAFAPPIDVPVSGNPEVVVLMDLDRDGRLDILAGIYSQPGGVDYLRNMGGGKFAAPVHYLASAVAGMKVSDVNGDQLPDLVVLDAAKDGGAGVFRNQGDGTLADAVYYPTVAVFDGFPVALDVGDIDNDGRADVVVAVRGAAPQNFSVLRNIGAGRFAAPIEFSVGGGPNDEATGVAIGDLDGDHWADIVVTTVKPGSLNVFMNQGNRQFARAQEFAVGGARQVTMADLDGDGGLDLLITRPGDSAITTIRSQCR